MAGVHNKSGPDASCKSMPAHVRWLLNPIRKVRPVLHILLQITFSCTNAFCDFLSPASNPFCDSCHSFHISPMCWLIKIACCYWIRTVTAVYEPVLFQSAPDTFCIVQTQMYRHYCTMHVLHLR
jgi:hypothetical protein